MFYRLIVFLALVALVVTNTPQIVVTITPDWPVLFQGTNMRLITMVKSDQAVQLKEQLTLPGGVVVASAVSTNGGCSLDFCTVRPSVDNPAVITRVITARADAPLGLSEVGSTIIDEASGTVVIASAPISITAVLSRQYLMQIAR